MTQRIKIISLVLVALFLSHCSNGPADRKIFGMTGTPNNQNQSYNLAGNSNDAQKSAWLRFLSGLANQNKQPEPEPAKPSNRTVDSSAAIDWNKVCSEYSGDDSDGDGLVDACEDALKLQVRDHPEYAGLDSRIYNGWIAGGKWFSTNGAMFDKQLKKAKELRVDAYRSKFETGNVIEVAPAFAAKDRNNDFQDIKNVALIRGEGLESIPYPSDKPATAVNLLTGFGDTIGSSYANSKLKMFVYETHLSVPEGTEIAVASITSDGGISSPKSGTYDVLVNDKSVLYFNKLDGDQKEQSYPSANISKVPGCLTSDVKVIYITQGTSNPEIMQPEIVAIRENKDAKWRTPHQSEVSVQPQGGNNCQSYYKNRHSILTDEKSISHRVRGAAVDVNLAFKDGKYNPDLVISNPPSDLDKFRPALEAELGGESRPRLKTMDLNELTDLEASLKAIDQSKLNAADKAWLNGLLADIEKEKNRPNTFYSNGKRIGPDDLVVNDKADLTLKSDDLTTLQSLGFKLKNPDGSEYTPVAGTNGTLSCDQTNAILAKLDAKLKDSNTSEEDKTKIINLVKGLDPAACDGAVGKFIAERGEIFNPAPPPEKRENPNEILVSDPSADANPDEVTLHYLDMTKLQGFGFDLKNKTDGQTYDPKDTEDRKISCEQLAKILDGFDKMLDGTKPYPAGKGKADIAEFVNGLVPAEGNKCPAYVDFKNKHKDLLDNYERIQKELLNVTETPLDSFSIEQRKAKLDEYCANGDLTKEQCAELRAKIDNLATKIELVSETPMSLGDKKDVYKYTVPNVYFKTASNVFEDKDLNSVGLIDLITTTINMEKKKVTKDKVYVLVRAFTDVTGNPLNNKKLSTCRSLAVKEIMSGKSQVQKCNGSGNIIGSYSVVHDQTYDESVRTIPQDQIAYLGMGPDTENPEYKQLGARPACRKGKGYSACVARRKAFDSKSQAIYRKQRRVEFYVSPTPFVQEQQTLETQKTPVRKYTKKKASKKKPVRRRR